MLFFSGKLTCGEFSEKQWKRVFRSEVSQSAYLNNFFHAQQLSRRHARKSAYLNLYVNKPSLICMALLFNISSKLKLPPY